MGLIPETICRRCGSRYSGLRRTCPKCGAPRMSQPSRVPPTTASATPRTQASARAQGGIRWQLIFGAVLAVAVILALVVLIATGGENDRTNNKKPAREEQQSSGQTTVYTYADLPTPSASPVPTPDASPTPAIDSMAITFLNNVMKKDITISDAGTLEIDLDVSIHPANDNLVVKWSSSNESILTVDERGIVKIVGANPNNTSHATIVAECCGLQAYLTVYVPSYQAAYLTENLFDANATDEWDDVIYASPTPRA